MRMSSDGLGVQFYFQLSIFCFFYFDVIFNPFKHYVGDLFNFNPHRL